MSKVMRPLLWVIFVACLVAAGTGTVQFLTQKHEARSTDQEHEEANAAALEQMNVLPPQTTTTVPAPLATTTTIPATTTIAPATTEAPTTTTIPETATTVFTYTVPENDSFPYNQPLVGLDASALGKGPFSVFKADMTETIVINGKAKDGFGHTALEMGPAIFLSSGYTNNPDGTRGPINNFDLPGTGQGGRVMIGGHRTTGGEEFSPFAHIDQLRAGELVTIGTTWGIFTYQVMPEAASVLSGCQNNQPEDVGADDCRTTNSGFWDVILPYENAAAETLFLFSCDDKGSYRLIVQLELVSTAPPVAQG
jgi:hypothetical protein